jgi:hypothetical protein
LKKNRIKILVKYFFIKNSIICNCDKKSVSGFNLLDEVNNWVVGNTLNIIDNIKKDKNVIQMVAKYVLLKVIKDTIEKSSKEEIDEFNKGTQNILYEKVTSIIQDLELRIGYKIRIKGDDKQLYPKIQSQAKGQVCMEDYYCYTYYYYGYTYKYCTDVCYDI